MAYKHVTSIHPVALLLKTSYIFFREHKIDYPLKYFLPFVDKLFGPFWFKSLNSFGYSTMSYDEFKIVAELKMITMISGIVY